MWKGPKKKKKQLNKEHKKVQLQKKGRERQNVSVMEENKDMQKNQERKESGIPGSSPKSNLVDGSGPFSLCFFF